MEDFEFDKHLKKAITAAERKKQKVFLQSVEASIKKRKKINWLAAASIAILIGFGGYFVFDNQSISNDELYSNYYYPYENVIEPIVRDQVKLTKKELAFAQYEKGNYQEAINGFNQLKPENSLSISAINFYKANAFIQLEELQKAQILFEQLIANDKHEWKEESLWYLALISLKKEETKSAINYLETLQNTNKKAFKTEEIKVLLKSLN